jgi:glucose-6-phosphate 1-dehydrogenase
VIRRLVLFGASGDLAGRYLLPALATLRAEGKLPDGFRVLGAAREDWDDAAFRDHAADQLERHAGDLPAPARDELLASLAYRQVDLADAESVDAAMEHGESSEPVAAYLALPPSLFAGVVTALGQADLPPGSRIVVEKPFGEDLESARELNRLLESAAGPAGEQAIFRVDHVLGMATTQRLIELRANRGVDALWRGTQIERVELLWEETLALEGRAGYYDHAGALKDVVQNHLMQLLCLAAMEPGGGGGRADLHDAKVDALRSIRELGPADVPQATRRARYTAGQVGEREVPDYVSEDGVDPDRGTETFAEIAFELGSERWAGTPFVLRAGKALGRRRKGVRVRFRAGAELWVGIDGPNDVSLRLDSARDAQAIPFELSAPPPDSALPPYGRVLLDVLGGGSALSIRGDEAEEAWKVVMPVLDAWRSGDVAMESYPAGSEGP